jgi:hypothetical protein
LQNPKMNNWNVDHQKYTWIQSNHNWIMILASF